MKPDAAQIYVAWQSFAVDGVPEVIVKGARLRGSHPAVVKAFQNFVPDGTPEGEWPSMWDSVIRTDEATDRALKAEWARREPPPIPVERRVVCTQSFRAGARTFGAGQTYDLNDKVVRENKNYFAWPPKPLT